MPHKSIPKGKILERTVIHKSELNLKDEQFKSLEKSSEWKIKNLTYLESEFHSLPTSGSEIEQEDEIEIEAEIIAEVNSEIKSETKSVVVQDAVYQTSQIETLIETVTSEIHTNISEIQSVNKLDTDKY